MDGKDRATDDICIERFWRKRQMRKNLSKCIPSIGDLITDVDDYIPLCQDTCPLSNLSIQTKAGVGKWIKYV